MRKKLVTNIFDDSVKPQFNSIEQNTNKWVVLLTMAINPNGSGDVNEILYRKKLYTKQINRWLNETDYEIFVTESTGGNIVGLSHERLHIINFNLINELGKTSSTSIYESHSIIKFIEYFKKSKYYNDTTHILKVTGRYFLPGIQNQLNDLNGYDVYTQIHVNDDNKFQNTEYFGINKTLLMGLAKTNLSDNNILERTFYNYIYDNNLKCIKLKPFQNDIKRGGDKLIINPL
jgi:hypothetical protein